MWGRDYVYVAAPRRVLQAHEISLVVAERGISVVRRGSDGRWRFAISLLGIENAKETTVTTAAPPKAVLDFNPTVGMLVEGVPPEDPETDPWRVIMVFAPNFAGPPLHVHPHQEESYEVLAGVLDVFVDGQWRELRAGESLSRHGAHDPQPAGPSTAIAARPTPPAPAGGVVVSERISLAPGVGSTRNQLTLGAACRRRRQGAWALPRRPSAMTGRCDGDSDPRS